MSETGWYYTDFRCCSIENQQSGSYIFRNSFKIADVTSMHLTDKNYKELKIKHFINKMQWQLRHFSQVRGIATLNKLRVLSLSV